jgi:hypothetical protein
LLRAAPEGAVLASTHAHWQWLTDISRFRRKNSLRAKDLAPQALSWPKWKSASLLLYMPAFYSRRHRRSINSYTKGHWTVIKREQHRPWPTDARPHFLRWQLIFYLCGRVILHPGKLAQSPKGHCTSAPHPALPIHITGHRRSSGTRTDKFTRYNKWNG